MESIIEKNHFPWIITISSIPSSINIKIRKNKSIDDIYENSFTLKKLQKSKVFSNKKNTKDIVKGIIYFIEQNKITYEENDNTLKMILTSYNKRILELILNKTINIENEKRIKNLNFILVNSIKAHNHRVSCVSIFPSGNFISVSCDKTIKIWDKINYTLLQCIEEAHNDYINYTSIKDENSFATCSRDQNIKIWEKSEKENKYMINKIIKNAHESWVFKIIYLSNNKIISCSYDKTVKIWENKNNEYLNIKTIIHTNNCIFEFNEVKCWNWNSLCKLDENRILIGGTHGIIKIISLNDKSISKEIKNGFNCWGISIIDYLGIFVVVGEGKNVKIYKKNDYEFIKEINDIHSDDIEGILQMNEKLVLTYSWDKTINIWKLE